MEQETQIWDVTRDQDGLAIALGELLEESFARSRVGGQYADAYTRDRIAASLPQRTLSPGYYRMAEHFFWLERRVKAHALAASNLVTQFFAFEMEGLVLADAAHDEFSSKHPKCSGCGAHQDSRFASECHACRASFRRDA